MGIPRILKRARGSKSQHENRHRWLALPALRPQSDPARNRDAVLGSLTGSRGKMSTHRQTKRRSFYQISTSTALVEGVHSASVSSSVLLEHGDFGLGTFEGLDGEMVILDGQIYQVADRVRHRTALSETCRPVRSSGLPRQRFGTVSGVIQSALGLCP